MDKNFSSPNILAEATEYPNSATGRSIAVQLVIGIILGIHIVVGVAGNLMVLAAVMRESKLHSRANYLIASLAVTDLLVSFLVLPYAAAITYLGGNGDVWWVPHIATCRLFIFLDVTCCTASILHLCVIAWVRYRKVSTVRISLYPRTFISVIPTIICIWFAAILLSVAPFFMFPAKMPSIEDTDISHSKVSLNSTVTLSKVSERNSDERCIVNDNKVYRVVATTVAFYAPLAVILVIYMKMARIAWSTLRRKRFKIYETEAGRNSLSSTGSFNSSVSENNSDDHMECCTITTLAERVRALVSFKKKINSPLCPCVAPHHDNEALNCSKINNNIGDPIIVETSTGRAGEEQRHHAQCTSSKSEGGERSNDVIDRQSMSKCKEYSEYENVHEIKLIRQTNHGSAKFQKQGESAGDFAGKCNIDLCSSLEAEHDSTISFWRNPSKRGNSTNTGFDSNLLSVPINMVSPDISYSSLSNNSEAVVYRRSQLSSTIKASMIVFPDGGAQIQKSETTDLQVGCKPRFVTSTYRLLSRLNMQRERKIIRTLGIVIGAFIVCWLPFFAKEVILPFCSICYLPPAAEIFINWLGYFNSVLNPIIYAHGNKDFNRAFKRMCFANDSSQVRRALSSSNPAQ